MQMRVDEARHQDQPGDVDHAGAVVFADARDAVAADRHVARHHRAGDQIEDPAAAQDQVGGLIAPGHGDAAFQIIHHSLLSVCGT